MKIENLLKYQSRDFEVNKLERLLNNSVSKKQMDQAVQKGKVSQSRSLQLEKQASDLMAEFENMKKLFEQNMASLTTLANTNYNDLSQTDLDSYENALNDMAGNVSIIENKLAYLAKSINVVLSNFDKEKKAFQLSRSEYEKNKEAFATEEQEMKPKIEEMQKELKELEKGIDSTLMTKYKARRQDGRFPIFVPLLNDACGGCQMALSISQINAIKEEQISECENCRRYIYFS